MALTAAGLLEPAPCRVRLVPRRPSGPTARGRSSCATASSKTPTATATSARTSPPACGTTCWSPVTGGSPRRMWPVVTRADRLRARPAARRRRDLLGAKPIRAGREALLTGCASIYHSIRCALALADYFDDPQPEWEVAVGRLGHAIAAHPESFAAKDRYSMEWYYPVLGGALRGARGHGPHRRALGRLRRPGLGIRCVDDRPWVTGAETCELVMALDAIGDSRAARTSSSPPCTTCAKTTAPTGPGWCSPTASAGRRSAPRGPAPR